LSWWWLKCCVHRYGWRHPFKEIELRMSTFVSFLQWLTLSMQICFRSCLLLTHWRGENGKPRGREAIPFKHCDSVSSIFQRGHAWTTVMMVGRMEKENHDWCWFWNGVWWLNPKCWFWNGVTMMQERRCCVVVGEVISDKLTSAMHEKHKF